MHFSKIEKLKDSKNYCMTKIKKNSIKNPGKSLSMPSFFFNDVWRHRHFRFKMTWGHHRHRHKSVLGRDGCITIFFVFPLSEVYKNILKQFKLNFKMSTSSQSN